MIWRKMLYINRMHEEMELCGWKGRFKISIWANNFLIFTDLNNATVTERRMRNKYTKTNLSIHLNRNQENKYSCSNKNDFCCELLVQKVLEEPVKFTDMNSKLAEMRRTQRLQQKHTVQIMENHRNNFFKIDENFLNSWKPRGVV